MKANIWSTDIFKEAEPGQEIQPVMMILALRWMESCDHELDQNVEVYLYLNSSIYQLRLRISVDKHNLSRVGTYEHLCRRIKRYEASRSI